MFQKPNIAVEDIPRTKFRLHIVIGSLVLVTFILAIARIAAPGTPSSRINTWGIAVCVKSAVFLAYQLATAHVERLKRWANTKINMVLNSIDTVFWFALFIISIMAAAGASSTTGKALGAIIIILAVVLCPLSGFLLFLCLRERRHYKQTGKLPGAPAPYSGVV